MSKEKSAISVFQKYLTVWVILCMVIGVLIGKFLPQINQDAVRMMKPKNSPSATVRSRSMIPLALP